MRDYLLYSNAICKRFYQPFVKLCIFLKCKPPFNKIALFWCRIIWRNQTIVDNSFISTIDHIQVFFFSFDIILIDTKFYYRNRREKSFINEPLDNVKLCIHTSVGLFNHTVSKIYILNVALITRIIYQIYHCKPRTVSKQTHHWTREVLSR